jgi:ABC-type lipoprotein release transport system permease subunit
MVKIYTVGYYSGFYSSLRDKILANGGHFEFSSKDEED